MAKDTEPLPQTEVITLDEEALRRFDGITEGMLDDFSRFTRDVQLRDGSPRFYTTVGRTYLEKTLERGKQEGLGLTTFMATLSDSLRGGGNIVITRAESSPSADERRNIYTFSIPSEGTSRIVGEPEAEIILEAFLPSTFSMHGVDIGTRVLMANKPVKERIMGAFERGASVEFKYNPPQPRARS